jgi:hypothetical protein
MVRTPGHRMPRAGAGARAWAHARGGRSLYCRAQRTFCDLDCSRAHITFHETKTVGAWRAAAPPCTISRIAMVRCSAARTACPTTGRPKTMTRTPPPAPASKRRSTARVDGRASPTFIRAIAGHIWANWHHQESKLRRYQSATREIREKFKGGRARRSANAFEVNR